MLAVGLGSPDQGRRFAQILAFPLELLYAGTQAVRWLMSGCASSYAHQVFQRLPGTSGKSQTTGEAGRGRDMHACMLAPPCLPAPSHACAAPADPDGQCCRALGYSAGFAPGARVSAYLKLLPMLAGIGSPGTLQEVRWR